jgi:electron transport complex protein RnfE
MNAGKIIRNGILDENPTFIQVIGMCPTLAVTTSAVNGVGMGLSTTVVLTCSNVAISLIRRFVPDKVRIPAYIVVIATFVTMIQLILQAYFPDVNSALGIFIPLIVVNCIILARAEAYASKNSVLPSALDGIGMGIGFTCALIVIGCVRELLGAGSLFGMTLLPEIFPRTIIMILPPGAFLTMGFLMAGLNVLQKRRGVKNAKTNQDPSCEGCVAGSGCDGCASESNKG